MVFWLMYLVCVVLVMRSFLFESIMCFALRPIDAPEPLQVSSYNGTLRWGVLLFAGLAWPVTLPMWTAWYTLPTVSKALVELKARLEVAVR